MTGAFAVGATVRGVFLRFGGCGASSGGANLDEGAAVCVWLCVANFEEGAELAFVPVIDASVLNFEEGGGNCCSAGGVCGGLGSCGVPAAVAEEADGSFIGG